MNSEKLNEEYIDIIIQIRELNKKRFEIFENFKKLNPGVKIRMIRTPSFYCDLYGNDLDFKTSNND